MEEAQLTFQNLNVDIVQAILNNSLDQVKSYVDLGADINFCSPLGFGGGSMSVLAKACVYDAKEIVDYLLEKGASVNLGDMVHIFKK